MFGTTDIVVIGLRALAFIAVIQSAGNALYGAVYGARFAHSESILKTITLAGALSAIVLVVLQHLLEPARMTAAFSGVWDGSLQLILLQSDAGATRAVRVLGLIAIAFGCIGRTVHGRSLLLAGATLTLSSFLLMGHTVGHPQRWLLSPMLIVHLLIAAFWAGALLSLLVAARREELPVYGGLVHDFSIVATRLVPLIALAGLTMALVLMPGFSSLTTPYGGLLLAKSFGFTVLIGLAAWNKLRLAPALLNQDQAALNRFRRVVAAEWILIALVLGATAVMTGLFGPE